jgi:hypothetical protein
MNSDSRLIFEAYKNKLISEDMPYPTFAKLSKHASPKSSREKDETDKDIHDLAKPSSKEHYKDEEEQRRLDPKCWSGYHKAGTKMKGGTRVNNCVKNQDENQKVDNIDAYQTKEMEQEEGALPSLYQFHRMLERHDWSYDYSDDSSVWRKGQQQEKAIMDAIKRGGQPYQDLYDKYVNQEKSGEKLEAPQKDRAELDQDRDTLHNMKSSIEEVRDKMYNDIDVNSINHPQQLWDLYYPAINILKVMKNIATKKGYKTLVKSLDQYKI